MKIIRKIGDRLFQLTDHFFQGSYDRSGKEIDVTSSRDQTNCMTWELNQGVEDIVIKDLRISINLLIPPFIRKPVEDLYKKVCFYFLVDAVIEEESLDPDQLNIALLTITAEPSGKKYTLMAESIKKVKTKVISFHGWLKFKWQRVSCFLRHLQPDKPYYLLGDFTPAHDNFYNDKSDFRHTYIFHLRN